jgi:nitrogen fixation protein NifB
MKIAIATTDGLVVNQHFGHTPEFAIVEAEGGDWAFTERRANPAACEGGQHDHSRFDESIDVIADCDALFVSKIGDYGRGQLERRHIAVMEISGLIDELLPKYLTYLQKPKRAFVPKAKTATKRDLSKDHPCFAEGKPGTKGRVHLPVSQACNIQCRFCIRSQNVNENRPGVASGILPLDNVQATVDKALELCPEITVVGIAGPGDSLASPHALEAFRLLENKHPELIKCLSTNGLALPENVQKLYDAGVGALTVTVNAVDPEIADKIVSHIIYKGVLLRGADAMKILIANQLAGIKAASDLGITVKVNTVLIPGVNDTHIDAIANAVANAGASKLNIIALIPQHELAHIPAPTCEQLDLARVQAGKYLTPFRHCQHCRADAAGVPGISDFASELYKGRTMETFSHG